jgi:hypothetical protein
MLQLTVVKKIIVSLAACFIVAAISAQNINISFKIVSKKNEPIADVSLSVIKRTDSSKKITKLTDSSGIVNFVLNQGEQYSIKASALNYKAIEKGITISSKQTKFVWMLEPSTTDLQEVTVVSRKPLMKQEDDKTIVEPENLALASSNGYEVLEKVPGLFMDQDGNVYLSATSPAKIFINGRDLKMSNDDMVTLLKNLPPGAILKIEILRTPSAKYDASGSGGIVNVVLKKGVKIGTTGSISAGWQQGTYANEFISLSLNNNNGKFTDYVSANFSKRNNFDHLISNRVFANDSLLSQNSTTTYPASSTYLGFGLGYSFNKKFTANYDGKISYNDFNNGTDNSNIISKISSGQILVNSIGNVNNNGKSFYTSHELSSVYKIDTIGSEWTNDVSYSYSGYNSNQVYNTNYIFPATTVTGGNGTIDNFRNTIIAQSDIKLKQQHHIIIETGLKTSVLQFNSNTNFNKTVSGVSSADKFRTNSFRYNENINAAYAQLSKSFGNVILKMGVRVENTNMSGHQTIPSDTSFNIHRTDFFPYIYLSKPLMKIASFELRGYLVYRRSITRPPYDYLNPFSKYVDQYLYETGNPNLKPQFTQNFEANVSVDERPIIALGYNDTKDMFTNVVYPSDSVKSIVYKTYDNLGKNKEIYFRALGAIPPGGKYFFVLGMQFNHNLYDGYYDSSPLLYKRSSYTLFTFHNLKFNKLTNITINGYVRFKGQQQFYDLATFGSLNASINRKMLKEKLTVTASCTDIFYTQPNDFTSHVGTINAYGTRSADSRRFGINLRYNFGFNKKDDRKSMFNDEGIER